MTLTELKYVIAVARERHFGRAAESCCVSQPSLSVAIKKLEEELGVTLFERRSNDIAVTPIGSQVIAQAQKVVEESRRSGDPAVLIASSEKIRDELGWVPKCSTVNEVISTAWKWHKGHPQGYEG